MAIRSVAEARAASAGAVGVKPVALEPIPLNVSDEMRPGLLMLARADNAMEKLEREIMRREIPKMRREIDRLITGDDA